MKHFYFCVAVTLLTIPLFAQGPFYTHFYGNESMFNPALVGQMGALSIGLKAKQQWHDQEVEGYRTIQAIYEESMPCSFFDYGFAVTQDQEGEGHLRTRQFGGMLAAPLRLSPPSANNIVQLRLGIGIFWGQQSVDYSRLLFIDQLHPKYGLSGPDGQPIATAFLAPNDGLSNWYFQPSGGANLRIVMNPKNPYTSNINVGIAMHNLVPWTGANGRGHSWSVLGLGTPTVPRLTYFLSWEKIAGRLGRNYIALQPQVFMQTQRGLAYLEMGGDVSFSRQFTLGAYYHTSRPYENQSSTNWGSIQIETGFFTNRKSRIDLGLGYSFNVSGLRNFIDNIYELSLRFSFAAGPACSLAGQPPAYLGQQLYQCPTLLQSAGRNKIYENIWYKNN
jgi:type IX secretion system PorP/SprF family membrane protein